MSNNASGENMITAKNIDELLSYTDEQFVICAYLTLLGRTPDPEGMDYYLGRLLKGYGKAKIITQIATSNDARKFGAKLPGLQQLIATQKRNDHWFWGFFSRGKRMELQANRMENELGRIMLQLQQTQIKSSSHHSAESSPPEPSNRHTKLLPSSNSQQPENNMNQSLDSREPPIVSSILSTQIVFSSGTSSELISELAERLRQSSEADQLSK